MITIQHRFVYAMLAIFYASSFLGIDKTLIDIFVLLCYAMLAMAEDKPKDRHR